MTVVLVHGNPETPAVWDLLLPHLDGLKVELPQLPGFGCPSSEGWAATRDDYVEWLEDEVRATADRDGPVDLVGHDLGGVTGARLVSQHPELVRSWVCDVLGIFHPDYVWHDFAQIWQTEGAGEEYFESMLAAPLDDRIALLESVGIRAPVSRTLAEAADEEMGRCILAWYRSARHMADWGEELAPAASKPGLAIVPGQDPFAGGQDLGRPVAEQLGATVLDLPDAGHWWMLDAPEQAAAALRRFWSSLG